MAARPRLNLTATYFLDSYEVEKLTLQKHSALMRSIILNQMSFEKKENKMLQSMKDLSLLLSQDHQKGKWKYADAEDLVLELRKRKNDKHNSSILHESDLRGISNLSVPPVTSTMAGEKPAAVVDQKKRGQSELESTQKFIKTQVEKQHASKYNPYEQLNVPQ